MSPQIGFPAPGVHNGVFIQVDSLYRHSYGAVAGISGTAVNQTGHDLRGCSLYFDVLNARGEKVGDALASTTSLKTDGTWRFQAVFMIPFSTTFNRVEVGRVQAY